MKIISEFGGLHRLQEFSNLYSNKNILLVTGKNSFLLSGAKKNIEDHLSNERITKFSNFSANPKIEDAIEGAKLARDEKIDVILAIGGGSVIDIAKLIKGFYLSQDEESEVAMGSTPVEDPLIPLIAVPTTAGSGSEATHFAVVYIGKEKYSLADQCLLPDAVILDGSLVKTGSEYQKSCNVLDAMAQAIESSWASGSNEESRQYAFAALKLGWNMLHDFVKPSCSDDVAQKMIEASNLAGKAINISKTTAAHAWSYAFTSSYNIPHGHSVWLTLPAIYEAHSMAKDNQITHPKGPKYMNGLINQMSSIMNLTDSIPLNEQLNDVLTSIRIETRMERLGADTEEKRRSISNQVNLERMSNNPVNLELFQSEIFRINAPDLIHAV